jgi:hypothetical protein
MRSTYEASQLHARIKGMITDHAPDRDWIATGVITTELGLQMDGEATPTGQPIIFPKGSYMLKIPLGMDPIQYAISDVESSADALVGVDIGETDLQHNHTLGRTALLMPGDRVVVVYVNGNMSTPMVDGFVVRS